MIQSKIILKDALYYIMSKIAQFRSSALTNINQGGGNKLAGIFPRVGGNTFARAAWARSAYVPVDKRVVVFCINQIGGIGKRKRTLLTL